MIPTQDTESQISLSVSEYDRLLQLAEESTNQILSAINSENAGRLAKLVKSRNELCKGLVLYTKRLKSILSHAASLDKARIDDITNRMCAGKKRLLEEQAECESALSARLHRCKARLTKLNQHQNLQNAYRGTNTPHQARFIDNRL